VDEQVKYAQHLHRSLQKQLALLVLQRTLMDAVSTPGSVGGWSVLASCSPFHAPSQPLRGPEQGSISMDNTIKRTLRYRSLEA